MKTATILDEIKSAAIDIGAEHASVRGLTRCILQEIKNLREDPGNDGKFQFLDGSLSQLGDELTISGEHDDASRISDLRGKLLADGIEGLLPDEPPPNPPSDIRQLSQELREEVIEIHLEPDKKRQGELVGRVTYGEERGKIALFEQQPNSDHTAGDVCSVVVLKRGKRFLKVVMA